MKTTLENLSVFINCPFDGDYKEVTRAITFAVVDCGFSARCAAELDDGSRNRLQKITSLVRACRFGIHDISMVEMDDDTGLPRFNMPFELGLFLGSSIYDPRHTGKFSLIFAHDKYQYRNLLSDLSGSDIQVHDNETEMAIRMVRNFLLPHNNSVSIPKSSTILSHHREFTSQLPALCKELGISFKNLIFNDYVNLAIAWLVRNAPPAKKQPRR